MASLAAGVSELAAGNWLSEVDLRRRRGCDGGGAFHFCGHRDQGWPTSWLGRKEVVEWEDCGCSLFFLRLAHPRANMS